MTASSSTQPRGQLGCLTKFSPICGAAWSRKASSTAAVVGADQCLGAAVTRQVSDFDGCQHGVDRVDEEGTRFEPTLVAHHPFPKIGA
jgi:hypothetical protein